MININNSCIDSVKVKIQYDDKSWGKGFGVLFSAQCWPVVFVLDENGKKVVYNVSSGWLV